MLEAAKAALQKAGFTIENLNNRIKELEAENAKLKDTKTCATCSKYKKLSPNARYGWCQPMVNLGMDKHESNFGCIHHEPKAP